VKGVEFVVAMESVIATKNTPDDVNVNREFTELLIAGGTVTVHDPV
jgi:hypothetical protein